LITDVHINERPLAGLALRLFTALILGVMFALVKLAANRGALRDALSEPTNSGDYM
jgi:hypothetical protein